MIAMTAQIPDGSVVVTPTDMYREIRDMHDELRALNSSINPALQEVRTNVAEIKAESEKVRADFETRLRALERWRWKAAGVIASIVTLGGIIEVLLSR